MTHLKNFSVLVPDVGASQASFYLINETNKLAISRPGLDIIVFYENRHKSCLPTNFSTMEISEAWCNSGPVIASSYSTAKKMARFPSERKLFYVWDLEWIRSSDVSHRYEAHQDVYCDPSIELIARSDSNKKAIENAFNRKVDHVVSDFNLEQILEILQ